MNLTISHLFISNVNAHQALITRPELNLQGSAFKLAFSKFSRITNSILQCTPYQKATIYRSSFDRILGSTLKFDLSIKQINNNFNYQINSTETDDIHLEECTFTNLNANRGAAIYGKCQNFNITKSLFINCHAEVGGAVLINEATFLHLESDQFYNNSAKYSGAIHIDSREELDRSNVVQVNATKNHAELWTAAMRIDRAGGPLSVSYFSDNSAYVCGAFFDFAFKTATRQCNHVVFYNNSATTRGGAFTCFHIMHRSKFDSCFFVKNYCKEQAYSISLESVYQKVEIFNCKFDGSQPQQVSIRYGESDLIIDDKTKFSVPESEMPEINAIVQEIRKITPGSH